MNRNHERPQAGTAFDAHQYEVDFIGMYLNNFVEFHLSWTIFFVGHLSRVRRHFDDLEDALLLSAFGLHPLIETARSSPQAGSNTETHYDAIMPAFAPTNAVRLSDLTGIPRETVRRKLTRFRQKGWIVQDAQGGWVLKLGREGRASVAQHFKELNAEFLQDLAKLMSRFENERHRLTMAKRQERDAASPSCC